MNLRYFFLTGFSVMFLSSSGQSPDANYILTAIPRSPGVDNYNTGNSMIAIQYFNGMGWPIQNVSLKAAPSGADLYSLTGYDRYGKRNQEWLQTPIKAEGRLIEQEEIKYYAKEFYDDESPYSKTSYDHSPLYRVESVTGPGQAWHRAGKGTGYLPMTNDIAGQPRIKRFVATTSLHNVRLGAYYSKGTLLVDKTVDEEGNERFRFSDKNGKTVLIRIPLGNGEFADTYYVYDNSEQLRFVLPPSAVDEMTNISYTLEEGNPLDIYAYIYDYDGYGNISYAKTPAAQPVYYLYDKAGRCILSQDGNMRGKGQWKAIAYDYWGRELYQAIIDDSRSKTQLARITYERIYTEKYNGKNSYGYSTELLDTIGRNYTVIKAKYYDNYNFTGLKVVPTSLKLFINSGYGENYLRVKGMLTGEMNLILDSHIPLFTVHYYDNKYREIQKAVQNELGGTDRHYYLYSFTGKLTKHRHEHSAKNKERITEVYDYIYDNADRMVTLTHTLNNQPPELIAKNVYDELGRIKQQYVSGYVHNYQYNLRGWTTLLSSPFFKEEIEYDYFNGNISSIRWKAAEEKTTRQYFYEYNAMNFLTKAQYGESNGTASTVNQNYQVTFQDYDKQGNMLTIKREGLITPQMNLTRIIGGGRSISVGGRKTFGTVENLRMIYKGNQLVNTGNRSENQPVYKDAMAFQDLADEEIEYTYDANGNMTSDLNKEISKIEYNYLNLPEKVYLKWIEKEVGWVVKPSQSRNRVKYSYDASGQKRSATYTTDTQTAINPAGESLIYSKINTITEYCENIIYENGEISRIILPNGYINKTGGRFAYHFYQTDHQGNIRAVYNADQETEQVNHYYPFGALFGESTQGAVQPHKYGAKELERMYGINWYDFEARYYDPTLCRFITMDPMAEKYYSLSPYIYCGNNPIKFIDPDGKAWRPTFDEDHDGNRTFNGYEWIPEEQSYDNDGNLLAGLYAQAIFFSDNGTFDASSNYNIGSSTAMIYLADGTTSTFDAMTNPSDPYVFATIPEGIYQAKVGTHNGSKSSYAALKMRDINATSQTIELGTINPAYPSQRTYATGIDIHKAGKNNYTGTFNNGKNGVSQGCLLIDVNNWSNFIGKFNHSSQKNNTVSVTVSRSMAIPVNVNRLPAFNIFMSGTRQSFFNPSKW